jgi:O-antigen/teichoic acid export membrane protein
MSEPPAGREYVGHQPSTAEELDRRILANAAWSAASHGGTLFLWLLTVLVLVRLLTPADFGLVSLASILLLFTDTMQGGGLRVALIQRQRDLEAAVASGFVAAVGIGVAMYGLLFAIAPAASSLFHAPRLDEVIRVIGLATIVRGFAVVPLILIERELSFRARSVGELSAGIVQAAVALTCAVSGLGVWSLVAGYLSGSLTSALIWWSSTPVIPNPARFDFGVLGGLFRYGRSVSAARMITLVASTADNVAVGRILGPTSVGFYGMAFRLATVPSSVLSVIAHLVMLPALAHVQDDLRELRRTYVISLERLAFAAVPFVTLLVIAGEPLVRGLLGEKWEPSVGPLRVLACYALIAALAATVDPLFEAAGHPHLTLYSTIPSVVTLVPALYVLTSNYGTTGTALAMVIAASVGATVRFVVSRRILALSLGEFARALLPAAACSMILAAAVLPVVQLGPDLGRHIVLVPLLLGGPAVYLAAGWFLARGVLVPVLGTIRGGRV